MQNVFDSVCDEANHAIVFVEQSHGFYALWLQNHLNTVILVNSKARVPFVTHESCFVNEIPVL